MHLFVGGVFITRVDYANVSDPQGGQKEKLQAPAAPIIQAMLLRPNPSLTPLEKLFSVSPDWSLLVQGGSQASLGAVARAAQEAAGADPGVQGRRRRRQRRDAPQFAVGQESQDEQVPAAAAAAAARGVVVALHGAGDAQRDHGLGRMIFFPSLAPFTRDTI